MRDLNLNSFADELYEKFIDMGVEIPRKHIRRLTKEFFATAEKAATKGQRFFIGNRLISGVYPVLDVKSLCNELAIGERNFPTTDSLLRKGKLQKRVIRFMKRRMSTTMKENALV